MQNQLDNAPGTAPLLGIRQLAIQIGYSEVGIRKMVDERRIPYIRVGKLIKFDQKVIAEWLAKRTVKQR